MSQQEIISPEAYARIYFNTTSHMTRDEVFALHGELLEGDLLLKFAELKNFDQAREIFEGWEEFDIIFMENYLIDTYRHINQLEMTQEQYIALNFLSHLIREWDKARSTGYGTFMGR